MDRKTLSHYGWIVVLILILSVMMAFATPFGEFIRTAVKSYIISFEYLLDETEKEISKNEIKNDIELNGSYIITNKEGMELCYVYRVNNDFNGYSLVPDGNTPSSGDRYFRCMRYVNIEEKREIKEMFYLANKLGYDATVEGRQGIQFVLLQYVIEKDMSDKVATLSSTAQSVYNNLISLKGSLEEETYKDIKLISIEKNSFVDIIFLKTDIRYILTDVYGKGALSIFKFNHDNNNQIFCIDRKVAHPTIGLEYVKINPPTDIDTDAVAKAFYIIEKNKVENDISFEGAAQIFLYHAIEGISLRNWVKLYVGTDEGLVYYDTMVEEYANLTDYEEYDIQYYGYINDVGEYQRLVGYTPTISN